MRVKRRNRNLLKNFTGYTPIKKYSHGGLYHDDDGNPVDKDGKPLPSNIPLGVTQQQPDVTRVDVPGLQQPGIQLLKEEPFDLLAEQLKQYVRLGRIQELKEQTEEGIVDPEYARLLQEEQDYQAKYESLYPEDRLTQGYPQISPDLRWMFPQGMTQAQINKYVAENPLSNPLGQIGTGLAAATGLRSLRAVIPGTEHIVGGVTLGDALNAYLLKEGIQGGIEDIPEFIDDPSLQGARNIAWDVIEAAPGIAALEKNVLAPFLKGYKRSRDLRFAKGRGEVPKEFAGSDIVTIPGGTSPMTLPAPATDRLISSAVGATQPIVSPQGVYDYGISEIDNIAGAANDIISSSYARGLSESATSGSDELINNIRDAVKSNTSYGIIDPASVLPDQIMFENFPQAGRNEIADVIDQTIFETSGFDALSPDLEELLMGVSNVLRDPGSLVRSLGYKPEIAGGWKLAAGSNPNSFLYSPPSGGGHVSASKIQLPNRSVWDLGIMPSSSKRVGPKKNMQLIAELTDQIPIGETWGIISASVDAYPLLVNASTRDRIQIAKAGSDPIYVDDVNTTLTELNQGDNIIHYRPLNGFGQGNFPTLTAEETDFLINSGKYLGVRDSNVQVLSEADRAAAKDRMDGVLGKVNAYLNKKGFPDAKVSDDFEILLPYPELVATRPRKPGEVLRRGGYITKKKRKKGYSVKR